MQRAASLSRLGVALVGCLLLSHCARLRPVSLAQLFEESVAAQRRGEYALAYEKASQGRDRAAADSAEHWRFHLQMLELRMSLGGARQVEPQARMPVPPGVPGREALEARRLMVLGWSLSELHRHDEAMQTLAASLGRAGAEEPLKAQIQMLRASVLGSIAPGSEEERLASLAALRHARAARDAFHEASAIGTLGYLVLIKGRYEEAIYWFAQVLPLAKELHSDSLLALTLDNLGWCWFRLGEVERAQSYFDQANALFSRMGKLRNLHINLGNQGSAWMSRRDYARAAALFERARRIAHDLGDPSYEADWLLNLAAVSLELGDLSKATAFLDEAGTLQLENVERQTPAWLALYRGRVAESRGDPDKAKREYESVLEMAKGEPTVLFEARSRMAKLSASTGDWWNADRQYRALLATLSEKRLKLATAEARISWLASQIRFFKDYVQFLWARGRHQEALAVAESSRARALSERTEAAGHDLQEPVSRLPAKARRSGCTLLSYWLGDRESYLWVFPPGGAPSYHLLPARAEIAGEIEAIRRQTETLRDPTQFPSLARLSSTLLPPGSLSAPACLVVSPDEELYRLNFETLLWSGRYLVEQAEVRVTPALSVTARGRASGRGLLLFGDPETPPQSDLPPLGNAGPELAAIGRLFPGSRTIRGPAATPDAFRQAGPGSYELIHIAAHATAQKDNPLDSAIVLSAVNGRYQLTAREVADLELGAQLVSLSACHSAGVRSYAGEGTVGLAWGFLNAGAHNVIAGLWAIDDRSSSRLLQQTYAGLRAGMPPAKALRAAKLAFLAESGPLRKPFYWAPFQLYSLD
jgi:tetratricopeptide (TPR) repeat protein